MMKNFLYVLVAVGLMGCHSPQTSNEMVQIDVTDVSSSVQLNLDDIADVEYIPLRSDSGFLFRAKPSVCTDNYILTKGGNDDILIFNRQGKALHRFAHYGQGPHEYTGITNLLLDERRQEIYVHDIWLRKMFVYDLEGDFVREYDAGDARFVFNYDDESFLIYNSETNRVDPDLKPYFTLVSKTDGKILERIGVNYATDKRFDLAVTKGTGEGSFTYTAMHIPIVRKQDGFLLNELSSDTIYTYTFDGKLIPSMARKPSIASMSDRIFLESGVETSKYIFLTKVSVNENNPKNMFPSTSLVYDKESGKLSKYTITNKDYSNSKMTFPADFVFCDIQAGFGMSRYPAYYLTEAYEAGKLSGKLEEIAASLKEDDNDVVVIYKFK